MGARQGSRGRGTSLDLEEIISTSEEEAQKQDLETEQQDLAEEHGRLRLPWKRPWRWVVAWPWHRRGRGRAEFRGDHSNPLTPWAGTQVRVPTAQMEGPSKHTLGRGRRTSKKPSSQSVSLGFPSRQPPPATGLPLLPGLL